VPRARQEPPLLGETLLVQLHRDASALKKARDSRVQKVAGITSDCAQSLQAWGKSNAACLVVRDNKALLVYVPYGSAPGWDFPGGQRHGGEFSCQTAERETCEETGYQVKAVARISSYVFKCEIVASNVCRKPVDEGFLRKDWFAQDQINGLRFRGGSWGDKQGTLREHLTSSTSDNAADSSTSDSALADMHDVCGCKVCQNKGFSSRAQTCAHGSESDRQEACQCAKRQQGSGGVDSCGCRPCYHEGWSVTRGRCAWGSSTDASEACECEKWKTR